MIYLSETFRCAAEAGPHDILKLYNARGHLINISPRIPDNTPDSRYTLHVVATHCPGIMSCVSMTTGLHRTKCSLLVSRGSDTLCFHDNRVTPHSVFASSCLVAVIPCVSMTTGLHRTKYLPPRVLWQ